MRIRHSIVPEPGDVFAPGAFDNAVGAPITVRIGEEQYQGTIVDGEVGPDGSGTLTLDVPGLTVDSQ